MAATAKNDGYIYTHPNGTQGAQTNAVVAYNLDPATGLAIGTASSPMYTQTSSLQTTADLTSVLVTISTATTTTIVSAAASVRTRVYRQRIDVQTANVLTFNATVNEVQNYAAAGFRIQDFATRPWFTTAVNTAFTVTTTTTGVTNILCEYTRVA